MKNNPSPRIDAPSTHVQAPNPQTAMKSKSVESNPPEASSEMATSRTGFVAGWNRFWFTPADVTALHALRVLGGLLFLFWLLPFAGSVEELFTFKGLFDREAYGEVSAEYRKLPPEQRPHTGWSVLYIPIGTSTVQSKDAKGELTARVLTQYVADNVELVTASYWITVAVLILFTLGIAPRLTAVLTYVLITSFIHFLDAPLVMRVSEDSLLIILAFCLMVGYVLLGQFSRDLTLRQRILGTWDTALPFLARLGKRTPPRSASEGDRPHPARVPASYAANLVLRLFQVNFAVMIVTTLLSKLQVGDWWSGVAFWYPLHPPFETRPADIHAEARHAMGLLFVYSLAQYLMLAWQLSFPVWAWRQNRFCRTLLIGGGLLGFIGCLWIYQAPAIAGFFLVGCLSFLSANEWRRLGTALEKFLPKSSSTMVQSRSEESRMAVAGKV